MIDFTGICKSYGRQDIFDNVSFRINPGERVGIVGPNGMGKTTLFQILTGELTPDKGEVAIPKKARLGYLRQQLDYYEPEAKLIDFVCAAEGELGRLMNRMARRSAFPPPPLPPPYPCFVGRSPCRPSSTPWKTAPKHLSIVWKSARNMLPLCGKFSETRFHCVEKPRKLLSIV